MKPLFKIILLVTAPLNIAQANGQLTHKKINYNTQTWVSINSNIFLDKHWFIIADAHVRNNGFFASNSFYFGRVGAGYLFDKKVAVAAGYGILKAAPATEGWTTKSTEHRIFEQIQFTNTYKTKLSLLQRLRNEQRWQEIIVNDIKAGKNKFSNRVRYLLSLNYQVFKKNTLPQIAFSDEILLQFGKEIIYNTFDQNRIFIGIKQKINNSLSFDTGYMSVFQQKSNGYSYTQNNTFRLFFYYTFKNHPTANPLQHKITDGIE